ncbi:MAG: V-type ATPase 116kDa subunit family protein [Actinomycetota bacterium]
MILPMMKVRIVGPKRYFYQTLNIIHYIGVLQMEDFSKRIEPTETLLRNMDIDEPSKLNRIRLEKLLGRATAIVTAIEPDVMSQKEAQREVENAYNRVWKNTSEDLAADGMQIVKRLELVTKDLATRKSDLENELGTLSKYENIVEKLHPLSSQLYRLQGFEAVALLINKKYGSVLPLIREQIGKITKQQFELVAAEVDPETIAAIVVFNKNYSEQVHGFLWSEKVNQLRLPESLADKPFDQILEHIDARKQEIPVEIGKINEKLAALGDKWYIKLMALKLAIQDRIEELTVPNTLAQTDLTFVISGWLPKKYYDDLAKSIGKEFRDAVFIEELVLSPEEMEEAPVVYENPRWAKPYELVMGIFQKPMYGTIDPTPYMAIAFPIFFGLIVGDMGIGAFFLVLSLFFRWRYKNVIWVKPVTTIAIMASLSTILFGIVYGEFFGNILELNHLVKEIHIMGIKFPINRIEAMMPMLYLSIGIGAVQVTLGLVLGVINSVKRKAKKHLAEKVGMLIVLFAIFTITGAVVLEVQALMTPSYVAILIGVVLLIYGAGLMGVIEIFGTLGNIFSYTRILAIGLAGMILAMVANEMVGAMGSISIGIIVALLLHALNIVIAAFSPTIHAFRLNVVEFHKQFVEYGGQPYKPFKRTGGG